MNSVRNRGVGVGARWTWADECYVTVRAQDGCYKKQHIAEQRTHSDLKSTTCVEQSALDATVVSGEYRPEPDSCVYSDVTRHLAGFPPLLLVITSYLPSPFGSSLS